MRTKRLDAGFWTRIVLSSLVANVPLAIAMVAYGMNTVLAFALSGAAGIATLAIWDGTRVPRADLKPQTAQGRIAQLRSIEEKVPA